MSTGNQQAAPSLEELLSSSEEYIRRLEGIPQAKQAEQEKPERELVLWTAIAGLSYYLDLTQEEDRELLQSLVAGTELVLRREPENEYDGWAVEVLTKEGRKIGYLTRYKNETIARMMDNGHSFEAVVESTGDLAEKLPEERLTPTEMPFLPFSVWLTG